MIRGAGRVASAAALSVLAGTAGCAAQPSEIRLSRVRPEPSELAQAGAVADELPVIAIEHAGIRGGRITAVLPAAPERLVHELLDFETADGHRAWAKHHTLIRRQGSRTVARWDFEGRLGIDPSVVIEFVERPGDRHTVVEFRLLEPAFGLAAFFGDYTIAAAETDAGASLLVMRVFIDSGLPFVNASAEDIAAGLRADVQLLREWSTRPPPAARHPASPSTSVARTLQP